MKVKTLLATTVVFGCLMFAGCRPKEAEPLTAAPTSPAPSGIPATAPDTLQVQADICGKLPTATVTSLVGIKVGAPSVTTIDSTTGAKRHVCTYGQETNPQTNVAYMNVTFKSENKAEMYQQLWDNQEMSQKENLTPVENLGTEAFFGQVDTQPVLYVLTEDAQYWLRLGTTTQSADRQKVVLQKLAESIVAK